MAKVYHSNLPDTVEPCFVAVADMCARTVVCKNEKQPQYNCEASERCCSDLQCTMHTCLDNQFQRRPPLRSGVTSRKHPVGCHSERYRIGMLSGQTFHWRRCCANFASPASFGYHSIARFLHGNRPRRNKSAGAAAMANLFAGGQSRLPHGLLICRRLRMLLEEFPNGIGSFDVFRWLPNH